MPRRDTTGERVSSASPAEVSLQKLPVASPTDSAAAPPLARCCSANALQLRRRKGSARKRSQLLITLSRTDNETITRQYALRCVLRSPPEMLRAVSRVQSLDPNTVI